MAFGYSPVSQAQTLRELRDVSTYADHLTDPEDGLTLADVLDPEDVTYLRHLTLLDQNRNGR